MEGPLGDVPPANPRKLFIPSKIAARLALCESVELAVDAWTGAMIWASSFTSRPARPFDFP
jgi:hypothetical protein